MASAVGGCQFAFAALLCDIWVTIDALLHERMDQPPRGRAIPFGRVVEYAQKRTGSGKRLLTSDTGRRSVATHL